MPENLNYHNLSPNPFAPEPDELDEKALDEVMGGLISPAQIQESQMSYNFQYLQLQSQMQNETRTFSANSKVIGQK